LAFVDVERDVLQHLDRHVAGEVGLAERLELYEGRVHRRPLIADAPLLLLVPARGADFASSALPTTTCSPSARPDRPCRWMRFMTPMVTRRSSSLPSPFTTRTV